MDTATRFLPFEYATRCMFLRGTVSIDYSALTGSFREKITEAERQLSAAFDVAETLMADPEGASIRYGDIILDDRSGITDDDKNFILYLIDLAGKYVEAGAEFRFFMLDELRKKRREIMHDLFVAAIDMNENALEKILREGVAVRRFYGDAATDIEGISRDAGRAAAKTRVQLEAAAKNGRASARTRKSEAGIDNVKATVIAEINNLLRQRDERYPDRTSGGEKGPSNNQIYRAVASKHLGENSRPIFTPEQIKEWFKPTKMRRRGGHGRK